MTTSPAVLQQPGPLPGDRDSCHDTLCAKLGPGPLAVALLERKALGLQRYGSTLQPSNGRDGLVDLLQELLDALAYCEQCIREGRVELKPHQDVLVVVTAEVLAMTSGKGGG